MAFVAVLYRDAVPEIVAAFLEVAHLMKARALHLRPRLGGGGPGGGCGSRALTVKAPDKVLLC